MAADPLQNRIRKTYFGQIAIMLSESSVLLSKLDMICCLLDVEIPSASDSPCTRVHRMLSLFRTKFGPRDTWALMIETLTAEHLELKNEAADLENMCRNIYDSEERRDDLEGGRHARNQFIPLEGNGVVGIGRAALRNTGTWLPNFNRTTITLAVTVLLLAAGWGLDRSSFKCDNSINNFRVQPRPTFDIKAAVEIESEKSSLTSKGDSTTSSTDALSVNPAAPSPDTKTVSTKIPRKKKQKKKVVRFQVTRLSSLPAWSCDEDREVTLDMQTGAALETVQIEKQNCTDAEGNVPNFKLILTGTTTLEGLYSTLCGARQIVTSLSFTRQDIRQKHPPETCILTTRSCTGEFPHLKYYQMADLTALASECVSELFAYAKLPTLEEISISGMDIVTSNLEFLQLLMLHSAATLTVLKIGQNVMSELDLALALSSDGLTTKLRPDFKILVEDQVAWASNLVRNLRNNPITARLLVRGWLA